MACPVPSIAKIFFGLFQSLYSTALLSPKDAGTTIKTFREKLQDLNTFLKPALATKNAAFSSELQVVNRRGSPQL